MDITGCGTAIVTPFKADGSIDESALRALVSWQIDSGIDFLVACGSTGEAATLDEEEWLRAVSIVALELGGACAGVGRLHAQLHAHSGSPCQLLKPIRGLSAVLSANPYYNKPSQEGQFQHFLALAKAVDPLPVVLYNIPGRTGVNLEPETVVRLAEAAPNIEAIKESSGKLPQMAELVHKSAPRLQDFLRRRQHGSGINRGRRARAHQRGSKRDSCRDGAHDPRRAQQRLGRCPRTRAPVLAAHRRQLLGFQSLPGKDCAQHDGPLLDHVRLPLVPPNAQIRSRLHELAGELGLLQHAAVASGR